jgi:TPR repeat protein
MKQTPIFQCFQNAKPAQEMGRKTQVIYSLCKGFGSPTPVACFLVFAVTIGLWVQSVSVAGENDQIPVAALEQLRKLANEGSVEAQYKLGRAYEEGLVGATEDYREAAKWYLKAAEKGNAQAQYKMGTLYTLGKGVSKDRLEAAKWFGKAAQQGYEPVRQQIQETGTKLKDQLLKDPLGMLQRRFGG